VGLTSVPACNARSSSITACTSGLATAPVVPSIWEEPAIGAIRVAPINPAVSSNVPKTIAVVPQTVKRLVIQSPIHPQDGWVGEEGVALAGWQLATGTGVVNE